MLELVFILTITFIVYFFVIPRINNEKFRLSNTLSTIRTSDFQISFGQLSTTGSEILTGRAIGYFISGIKMWPRGPLEIMITSSITHDEIEAALESLFCDTCVVTFERTHLYFKERQITKIKLKKSFFFITIDCEPKDILNEFRDALIKLKVQSA